MHLFHPRHGQVAAPLLEPPTLPLWSRCRARLLLTPRSSLAIGCHWEKLPCSYHSRHSYLPSRVSLRIYYSFFCTHRLFVQHCFLSYVEKILNMFASSIQAFNTIFQIQRALWGQWRLSQAREFQDNAIKPLSSNSGYWWSIRRTTDVFGPHRQFCAHSWSNRSASVNVWGGG